jgi:hypothetical protein
VLRVDASSGLTGLECNVCHCRVRNGDAVLVSYRTGSAAVTHAHVCLPPRRRISVERRVGAAPGQH